MADIFISYASDDRDQARLLAAMLESEGYTVWWDTSLLSGDNYRTSIMTELGKSRAAIVVWSKNSVGSEWVQSEAGRAHANQKLIPVKVRGLDYTDIPLPFDNIHTENLADHDKILAAVVSQLAKPELTPSTLPLVKNIARFELISWLGILGGAITLFTNMGSLLKLSDWARWVVVHWVEWVQTFWSWVFSIFSIEIPLIFQLEITFTIFLLITSISSNISNTFKETGIPKIRSYGRQFIGLNIFISMIIIIVIYPINKYMQYLIELPNINDSIKLLISLFSLIFIILEIFLIIFFIIYKWPTKHAINTSIALTVLWFTYFISAGLTTPSIVDDGEGFDYVIISASITIVISIIMLFFAVPKLIPKRFWSILIFLVIIICANEISKLDINILSPIA